MLLLLPILAAAGPRPAMLGFAYFYKPPADGTPAAFVARHFQLILLSHGDEAYGAELRRLGYRGPILQALPANAAEGPGPYANSKAACDVGFPTYPTTVVDRVGEFCRQVHPHEGWFLHNFKGERLYTRYQSYNRIWRTMYAMNPGSVGWRRYVIARLRERAHGGFDGFFLDNVDLSRAGLLQQMADRGGVREYSSDASYRAAVVGYLAALRKALPATPLWANLAHDDYRAGGWGLYLPYLSGLMVEDFALGWQTYPMTPTQQAGEIANIQIALARGKQVLLVVQGRRHDAARRRLTLALAWALADTGAGHLYYRYNDSGVWDYRQVWWSPLYRAIPPPPSGPLHRSGNVWTRTYPGGQLQVDLAHGTLQLPPRWRALWDAAQAAPGGPLRGERFRERVRGKRREGRSPRSSVQAVALEVQHRLHPVTDVQLLVSAVEMGLDGGFANRQLRGNLFVALALRERLEHAQFPWR